MSLINCINQKNKNKITGKQNYDYQQLFDVLLNRGQETFSLTDAFGNLTTETRHGYGTFWPTNAMHDSIAFPEKPKEPIKPVRSKDDSDESFDAAVMKYNYDLNNYNIDKINYDISNQLKNNPTQDKPKKTETPEKSKYSTDEEYEKAKLQHQKDLEAYKKDKFNYDISNKLKTIPTFHHLEVVYDKNNKVSPERLETYLNAGQSERGKLLKEFYLLEEKFKNDANKNK